MTMYRLFCALLISFFLLSGTTWAGPDLETVLQGIKKNYGDLPGLSLTYKREVISKTMAMLGDHIKGDLAEGSMFFKPPHFLRLEQKSPRAETIVYDEETLWWHIADQNRVYKCSTKEFGREMSLLSELFQGLVRVKDRFKATPLNTGNPQSHQIELMPVTPWQNMDYIVLTVNHDYQIKELAIHYLMGSVTIFTLTDIREMKDFKPHFFRFEIPKDAFLIEERDQNPNNQ